MADYKISIIVPCYNVENYIGKCMESLIGQTFADIEIIAVNDGSKDKTLSILSKYAAKDERIKVIDKHNEGVSAARNLALKKAEGEYIMFVDADDWIELNNCETAYNTAVSNNADVVMWSYIREFAGVSQPKKIFEEDLIFYENNEVQSKLHRRFAGLIDSELAQPENMDALCPIWGKLYKKEIITKNNLTFENTKKIGSYEDGLFNLHLFQFVKKAVFINKYLYHYRKDNSASITSGYNAGFKEKRDRLLDIMEEYIDSNNLSEDYKTALKNKTALNVLGIGLIDLSGNHSISHKIENIKKVLRDKRYREALKQLPLKYFPLHWKVFYLCAKLRFSLGVFVLLVVISKIINR